MAFGRAIFLRLIVIYCQLILFCWTSTRAEDFVDAGRTCDSPSTSSEIAGAQLPLCFSSRETNRRLVCFGGIDDGLELRVRDRKVRTLVLCGWPNKTFDPSTDLRRFPLIRKLMIANSNITRLISPFSKDNRYLEKIAVTRTRLEQLPKNAFAVLPLLKVVDLRNNSLGQLDPDALNATSLRRLYLAGNPLRCTEAIAWMLSSSEEYHLARKMVDREQLRCSSPYEGRPLVPILRLITTLKEECAQTVCECELVYTLAVRRNGKADHLMAFNSVNCSARGLTEMPTFLPANTTSLRLNGNKIRDLSPLVSNPTYERVLDLYLDDNEITSILDLEGSYWLDHFRLFSLRGNHLSDLPTYALENALLRSDTAATLNLGNNPWRCDCLFTPGFQDLLVRYSSLVKDIDEIKCGYISNDENSGKQIRDLTRTEICAASDDQPWIHPLDILNILLASSILLVLGKLLYDYWSFKSTGKLPWIVTKIP